MDIRCPNCNQLLDADVSLVGATVTCPGCGKSFTVPENVADGLSSDTSRRTSLYGKRRIGRNLMIIGSIGLVLVLCILAFQTLKYEVGQHVEDGEANEVLIAEQQLLDLFSEGFGGPAAELFLENWFPFRSQHARCGQIPWAWLKSREQRIEARIQRVQNVFEHEVGKALFNWERQEEFRANQRHRQGLDFEPEEQEPTLPSSSSSNDPKPVGSDFRFVNGRPVWN